MRTKKEEIARLKELYQEEKCYNLKTIKKELEALTYLIKLNAYTSIKQAIITKEAHQEIIKELEEEQKSILNEK